MGADERDGVSALAAEVRGRTENMAQFFDGGAVYISNLRSIFDRVVAARSATLRALGSGEGTPPVLVAKPDYSGVFDSFAELLAEARTNNRFVQEIHDALEAGTAVGGLSAAPVAAVQVLLAGAGLEVSGEDLTLGDDRLLARNAEVEAERDDIRAELDEIVARGSGFDHAGYSPHETIGIGLDEFVSALDHVPTERRALVAEVMVGYGLELQAGLDRSNDDHVQQQMAATLLVNQGLTRVPEWRLGELVDRWATERIETAAGMKEPTLELLVDALDLAESGFILSDQAVGTSLHEWPGDNQIFFRRAALDRLIGSTLGYGGEISLGGQRIVDDTLDRYPGVVGAADGSRLLPVGRRWETAEPVDLRGTLATALAAPNYGLSDADYTIDYTIAGQIDHIDAGLLGRPSGEELDLLWFRRRRLVAQLADGDEDVARLLNDAMARGLSGPEAARLATFAATPGETNRRVRRLRLVYETNPFGQPLAVDDLQTLELPAGIARSLMIELAVLQTVQEIRFNRGLPAPNVPLTGEQIDLVRRYEAYVAWVHNFGNGWAFGHQEAMRQIAAGEEVALHELPDGLRELAVELSADDNAIIWELLPGASDNDTFLRADGGYRPHADGDHVSSGDPLALRVQMALVAKLGPHQAMLDLDGDGVINEGEVERWLRDNENDPNIPPALLDQIRVGQNFGIGEDTFGWEEVGELIGWVGLAAAVTATIAYSGGTSAPLWVQAGLVGLAAAEGFAFVQADDPFNAALAGVGGLADLAAAARLLRNARLSAEVPFAAPASAGVVVDPTDELAGLAARSDISGLRNLAAQVDDLGPIEFRSRYEAILGAETDRLARELLEDGIPPARVAQVITELDPARPLAPGRIVHAIDGNINGAGLAVGGHYARSPSVRVLTRSAPDANGVTTGTIQVWNPDRTRWVTKTGPEHTFFPEWWTRRRTELEIDSAFTNSQPVPTTDVNLLDSQGRPLQWEGVSAEGVTIRGRFRNPADLSGGWESAYPVFGR